MEKEALNGKATITCPYCKKTASLQFIYSLPQTAHLLGKNLGQVQSLIREGKLKFRYELRSGWTVKRVVDFYQLQAYIDAHIPRPEDLETEDLNTTKVAINRILKWYRKGHVRSKATIARKMAEKRRQTEPD